MNTATTTFFFWGLGALGLFGAVAAACGTDGSDDPMADAIPFDGGPTTAPEAQCATDADCPSSETCQTVAAFEFTTRRCVPLGGRDGGGDAMTDGDGAAMDAPQGPTDASAMTDGDGRADGSGTVGVFFDAGSVDLNRVWGSAPNDVFVVGNGGTVLHYDGAGWSPMAIATTKDLLGVWGTGANDVWAVGEETSAHYDGQGWQLVSLAPFPWSTYYDVWGITPDNYQAGHSGGWFIRWNGSAWVDATNPGEPQKNGIHGCAANDIWGTDEALGWIAHFDGSQWTNVRTTAGVGRYGVYCRGTDDVFFVGEQGSVLHKNGGQYDEEASGTRETLREVAPRGSEMVAVGTRGTIVVRNAQGTWNVQASGTTADLRGVWFGSDGVGFAVGQRGTILRL